MTCYNCKYWEESDYSEIYKNAIGECHRYPPQQQPTQPKIEGVGIEEFPYENSFTIANYWCGEFKEKPND